MEVNKEQAEKCRDLGAEAIRRYDYDRAIKMLSKSLQLHPLPGVEALLGQAKREQQRQKQQQQQSSSTTSNGNSSSSSSSQQRRPTSNGAASSSGSSSSSSASSPSTTTTSQSQQSQSQQTGSGGRSYTDEQEQIVKDVLKAKEGGRGAHYRVLKLQRDCNESDIKKAYRKLSLKVHPDKNAAPKADEAFKAVGLAYATLSDSNKRSIYDRYGDEDPDNRGGGGTGPMGRHHAGQEVSPEDIFNMFFGMHGPGGGGMGGGGGPGVHMYSTGFGPGGIHFRTGGMPRQQPRRRGPNGQRGQQQEQEQQEQPSLSTMIFNLLPMLLIMFLSFFRLGTDYTDSSSSSSSSSPRRFMPGEQKYFSLTQGTPFLHPLQTRLSAVKDIPYYVTDRFLRTYYRDRYQLGQVEQMVERAYENYVLSECNAEHEYYKQLQKRVQRYETTTTSSSNNNNNVEQEERSSSNTKKLNKAKQDLQDFQLHRCQELDDLFPIVAEKNRKKQKR